MSKIKNGGLDQYGPECSCRLIFATIRKECGNERVNVQLASATNNTRQQHLILLKKQNINGTDNILSPHNDQHSAAANVSDSRALYVLADAQFKTVTLNKSRKQQQRHSTIIACRLISDYNKYVWKLVDTMHRYVGVLIAQINWTGAYKPQQMWSHSTVTTASCSWVGFNVPLDTV